MIVLIDNYDSFSYNLVQLIGERDPDIRVIRNDEMNVEDIRKCQPSHIIISPGPGHPGAAGICEQTIAEMKGEVPILGVCLGHQAICEVFGAKIRHAKTLMHGKKSNIKIENSDPIFQGLPNRIDVARYHSLIADMDTIPDTLDVIAADDHNEVMAVRYKEALVYGLQFHPESILTPEGGIIIDNFLAMKEGGNRI